ncbi:hypothetical protein AVEN_165475-1 [Araneus ventricosus]|uniref:Uncharacterized protein n=1 Tax=Araneus ventricosus TaxID=182803 RepID=A0A4Y2UY32_ARAVE|nr:hypothetical protein AVEN_165475-1 [Araneus ventricosus]
MGSNEKDVALRRVSLRVTAPLLYSPGKRDPDSLSDGFSFTNTWCPPMGPMRRQKVVANNGERLMKLAKEVPFPESSGRAAGKLCSVHLNGIPQKRWGRVSLKLEWVEQGVVDDLMFQMK